MTRVENVEDEAELLRLARTATASQLERLLRAYRRVVRTERGAAGGRPDRWLEYAPDDHGGVVIRGRFPAEEGELIWAALRGARDRLAHEDVPAGTSRADRVPRRAGDPDISEGVPAGTPKPTIAEASADALLALADTFLGGGSGARTGGDRYQVVVHVDSATLRDGSGDNCELADGTPLSADTARRLACDAFDRAGARTRRRPAEAWPQDPDDPSGAAPRAQCPRRRLPVPGLYQPPVRRRASHPTLGARRRHRSRQPRAAVPPSPPAPARGALRDHADAGRQARVQPSRRLAHPNRPPSRFTARTAAADRRSDACVSLSEGQRMDLGLAVEAVFACAPLTSGEPPGV